MQDPTPPPRVHPMGQQLGGQGRLGGAQLCPEGPHGRSPFTFYHSTFSPLALPAQVARRSLYSRVGNPAPGRGGRFQDSHIQAHAHTDVKLSVHPSIRPRSRAWTRGPQGSAAHQQQQHAGRGPALTLVGAQPPGLWPFMSAGPRCWVGLGAAGRGQTQSRPPRSWSWGCPGCPASTARKAPTGPGTRRWTSQ